VSFVILLLTRILIQLIGSRHDIWCRRRDDLVLDEFQYETAQRVELVHLRGTPVLACERNLLELLIPAILRERIKQSNVNC